MYLFFGRCLSFFLCLDFVSMNPMVGLNVRRALEGEFPSVVGIKKISNATATSEDACICTGTLVTNLNVLTAAHCLHDVLPRETEIIVGSIDISRGSKHYVLWWLNYNTWAGRDYEYVRYRINDVAVIRLTAPVNNQVVPAELNVVPSFYLYRLDVVAAGWGVSNDGTNPRFLETVKLKTLTPPECTERIERACGSRIVLPQNLICSAANPFALLINGDSGCPIFIDNVIIGVHKSTIPFPNIVVHEDKVNVHSSVVDFKEFIEDVCNRF